MPGLHKFEEKRTHPRVQMKVPVKYRFVGHQVAIQSIYEIRKNDQKTETKDLSLGGMRLLPDLLLDVGSLLRMEINLPEASNLLSAFAEVIWANEGGCGIKFLTMKDNDSKALSDYLARVSS